MRKWARFGEVIPMSDLLEGSSAMDPPSTFEGVWHQTLCGAGAEALAEHMGWRVRWAGHPRLKLFDRLGACPADYFGVPL